MTFLLYIKPQETRNKSKYKKLKKRRNQILYSHLVGRMNVIVAFVSLRFVTCHVLFLSIILWVCCGRKTITATTIEQKKKKTLTSNVDNFDKNTLTTGYSMTLLGEA